MLHNCVYYFFILFYYFLFNLFFIFHFIILSFSERKIRWQLYLSMNSIINNYVALIGSTIEDRLEFRMCRHYRRILTLLV